MTDTQNRPQARMLKLKTGEQLIALMYVQDNSDFIRLENPYKIDLHPFDFLGDYVIEEKMTMKPWLFKTKDKVFSVHKNHIITLAVPEDSLSEYYMNLISGRIKPPSICPSCQKEDGFISFGPGIERVYEDVKNKLSSGLRSLSE